MRLREFIVGYYNTFGGNQMWNAQLSEKKRLFNIRIHRFVIFFFGDILEKVLQIDAGVIHKNINAPELAHRFVHHSFTTFARTNISNNSMYLIVA